MQMLAIRSHSIVEYTHMPREVTGQCLMQAEALLNAI